jgi:1,4-dihydroxy-2-naphthoyl-CoA hydrolase
MTVTERSISHKMETKSRIWMEEVDLAKINRHGEGTMVGHLGIEFTEVGDDYIVARMPVDWFTKQPFGFLHGGASVALAETVGSTAGNHCVDRAREVCVGVEVNANHLRSKRTGVITATGRPLHLGRRIQIWEMRIEDEAGALVAVSRLTLAVVEKR